MGWEESGELVPKGVGECYESIMPLPCLWKKQTLREVPLPTLMTLELSPHQPLLWLTAHPWDPSTNLVLRINCLLKACFCSCPWVYAFGPFYRVHYSEAQGLAAALGLRQRVLVRFPRSFDFHSTIAKGRFLPLPWCSPNTTATVPLPTCWKI